MNTYCCDKFRNQCLQNRETGLNIRILKFNEVELLDNESPYRFFITPGYSLTDKLVPTYNISFCPFCGQNLFMFYKDDRYVNENDNNFLYP